MNSTISKACRDCGAPLPLNVRGCTKCAMNLEAETMIERFIWRRFVPAVTAIVVLAALLFYWLG